jgi:hypothetical protein
MGIEHVTLSETMDLWVSLSVGFWKPLLGGWNPCVGTGDGLTGGEDSGELCEFWRAICN